MVSDFAAAASIQAGSIPVRPTCGASSSTVRWPLRGDALALFLLISGVIPNAGAFQSGELRTYQSTAKNLAPPNSLIGGDNAHALYDQGDSGAHSGVASEDSDSPDSYRDGLLCDYHENLEYTQETTYLPDGMPAFRVTFTNTCLDCSFYDIHILCGGFSSPKLVNPKIFRRLSTGNCLLNNGGPFHPQDVVEFEYESTYAYPMKWAKPSVCVQ